MSTQPLKISDKAQKAIQDQINKLSSNWHPNPCCPCVFAILSKTTGESEGHYRPGSHACHAGVRYARETQIVVDGRHPGFHGNYPELMKWVCRESPFAHGVLNKDNEEEIVSKAAVIDPALVGCGGALWLCKAARHVVEDTWKPPIWMKLREAGLDGLQAFVGADILDSEGNPAVGHTHVGLFRYCSAVDLRNVYDEIKGLKRIDDSSAARPNGYNLFAGPYWGSMKSKTEKRSDGWGGFTEVKVPQDAKEYVNQLKEIFEGDPKNVK